MTLQNILEAFSVNYGFFEKQSYPSTILRPAGLDRDGDQVLDGQTIISKVATGSA